MKGIRILFVVLIFLPLSWGSFAASGSLFNVESLGNPQNISITLCLNGRGPVSCQNFTATGLNLSITTTVPNHVYSYAGIKINTPGYTIDNLGTDCTQIGNGYCLFSLSNTAPKALTLVNIALAKIKHFVIIYQENHSFDNLYGNWEGVNGVNNAEPNHTIQVTQAGVPFSCIDDLGFSLDHDLSLICTDNTTGTSFQSHFSNTGPILIDTYQSNTIPMPDMVHRFYQEKYQLNLGKQDRFMTGSDSVGYTMFRYDTTKLPIYTYLHQLGHPKYAILDNFFHAALGGSFLGDQWLIAATTPVWVGAVNDGSSNDLHSVVDENGMPISYALYNSPAGSDVIDNFLSASCNPAPNRGPTPPGVLCGDYVLNNGATPPLFTNPTIADRLNAAGIDWSWYTGIWNQIVSAGAGQYFTDNPFTFYASFIAPSGCPAGSIASPDIPGICVPPQASSPCPEPFVLTQGFCTALLTPDCIPPAVPLPSFNLCVLPPDPTPTCTPPEFLFYGFCVSYITPTPASHDFVTYLRDETEFQQLSADSTDVCQLKPVSFLKPYPIDEHPGQDVPAGQEHVVDLIQAIEQSACAKDTMIILTYDENGGSWDHVPPPGSEFGQDGPHDAFGPGTRIPALIIAPFLKDDFVVDNTQYDTTSILATLEERYGLPPLATRDAAVNSLANVFNARAALTLKEDHGAFDKLN